MNAKPQVVVTAAADRKIVRELARHLKTDFSVIGAEVTCEQVFPINHAQLRAQLAHCQWLVFTSPRSVRLFPIPSSELPKPVSVATVGSGTANAAQTAGWETDLVGAGSAQALLEVFPRPQPSLSSSTTAMSPLVLLPGSALRKSTLSRGLHALGWQVQSLDIYTMVALPKLPECYYQAEYIVVTSGSAFMALKDIFNVTADTTAPNHCPGTTGNQTGNVSRETFPPVPHQHHPPKLICIGEPSAQVAQAHGIRPAAVASAPTAEGLAAALRNSFLLPQP